jgi:GMP synthase-like glutamine amidotransferase
MRSAATRGQPVFGVCLGAQLLARALGARVDAGAAREAGWHEIDLTAEAAEDPVFSRLDGRETVFQLHDDAFTLPEGATALASSGVCPRQAFRFGRAIYGVQFHPEMTPEMLEDWRRELHLPSYDTPPGAFARLALTCDTLLGAWSELL